MNLEQDAIWHKASDIMHLQFVQSSLTWWGLAVVMRWPPWPLWHPFSKCLHLLLQWHHTICHWVIPISYWRFTYRTFCLFECSSLQRTDIDDNSLWGLFYANYWSKCSNSNMTSLKCNVHKKPAICHVNTKKHKVNRDKEDLWAVICSMQNRR